MQHTGGKPRRVFTVRIHVRHAVRTIMQTPEAREKRLTTDIRLVGAVYELESGRVRFLE